MKITIEVDDQTVLDFLHGLLALDPDECSRCHSTNVEYQAYAMPGDEWVTKTCLICGMLERC